LTPWRRGTTDREEITVNQPPARAVRFDRYGGTEVLYLAEIPVPTPAAGEVLVAVRAAGINPGEATIRSGAMHERFPATFPSGQGSDLAGVVAALGEGVTDFAVGDEVLGYSWRRSSQAGGVGSLVVQLLAMRGVRVLGIASSANDAAGPGVAI
jgi:NADPH2:quinone reductase